MFIDLDAIPAVIEAVLYRSLQRRLFIRSFCVSLTFVFVSVVVICALALAGVL